MYRQCCQGRPHLQAIPHSLLGQQVHLVGGNDQPQAGAPGATCLQQSLQGQAGQRAVKVGEVHLHSIAMTFCGAKAAGTATSDSTLHLTVLSADTNPATGCCSRLPTAHCLQSSSGPLRLQGWC